MIRFSMVPRSVNGSGARAKASSTFRSFSTFALALVIPITTAAQTSDMKIDFTGRIVVNAFANSRRVNNQDVPQFVRADTIAGEANDAFGMAARQTTLGAIFEAERVLGAAFTGDIDIDFFGGQMASSGGRTFPLVRLRTARAIFRWTRAELLIGQESPLVAALNPVSLASIGTPGFAGAGNLWLWLPQVRMTGEFGTGVRIAIQGAVLAPTSGDPVGLFDTDPDSAEQSRKPFVQGRLRVRFGSGERPIELGLGVHQGWLMTPATGAADAPLQEVSSHGWHTDARIPVGTVIDIRGELYDGTALRGLGGGGVGQGIAVTPGGGGRGVRDRGGWAQVNLLPEAVAGMGAGCGASNPRDSDLRQAAAPRLRNAACAAYLMGRPAGPFSFAFEYRRIETSYRSGTFAANHFNVAMAVAF